MLNSTRRTVLGTLLAGAATSLAGCSRLAGAPNVRSTYQSYRPVPVLDRYRADGSTAPFYVQCITSQEAATERLNLDALPDSTAKDWEEIDYSRTTVTALVSHLMVDVDGPDDPVRIDRAYRNGTYTYRLTVEEWPETAVINSRQAYFTVLDAWTTPLVSESDEAAIEIGFAD